MKTRKTAEMGVRAPPDHKRGPSRDAAKAEKEQKGGGKEMPARVTESTLVFPPTPFCHRSENPTAAAAAAADVA